MSVVVPALRDTADEAMLYLFFNDWAAASKQFMSAAWSCCELWQHRTGMCRVLQRYRGAAATASEPKTAEGNDYWWLHREL
jgi:hypothetical protein